MDADPEIYTVCPTVTLKHMLTTLGASRKKMHEGSLPEQSVINPNR